MDGRTRRSQPAGEQFEMVELKLNPSRMESNHVTDSERPSWVKFEAEKQTDSNRAKRPTNQAIARMDVNGNVDQKQNPVNQNEQPRSFRSVVQKHFLKDRVFHLVHDLLGTIDDEKHARDELLDAFKEARTLTNLASTSTEPQHRFQPQPRPASTHPHQRRASITKPRRQRRHSEVPLLARITHARRNSIALSEDINTNVAESVSDSADEATENKTMVKSDLTNSDTYISRPHGISTGSNEPSQNPRRFKHADDRQAPSTSDMNVSEAIAAERRFLHKRLSEIDEYEIGRTKNSNHFNNKTRSSNSSDESDPENNLNDNRKSPETPKFDTRSDVKSEEGLRMSRVESPKAMSDQPWKGGHMNVPSINIQPSSTYGDSDEEPLYDDDEARLIRGSDKRTKNGVGRSNEAFEESNSETGIETVAKTRNNPAHENGYHNDIVSKSGNKTTKENGDNKNNGTGSVRRVRSAEGNHETEIQNVPSHENNDTSTVVNVRQIAVRKREDSFSQSYDHDAPDKAVGNSPAINGNSVPHHRETRKAPLERKSSPIDNNNLNGLKKEETKRSPPNETCPVDKKLYGRTIEVEHTSSEDNEVEGDFNEVDVVGSDAEVRYSDTGDRSGTDGDENDSQNVSPSNGNNSMEYLSTKHPASAQPKLDPIAEASHESFHNISTSSGSETKSIIEIQYVVRHRPNNDKLVATSNTDRAKVRKKGNGREEGSSKSKRDKPSKGKSENRTNGSHDNSEGIQSKTKSSRRKSVKSKPEKVVEKSDDDACQKLLSLDLLGVYETNEDLQTIHKLERSPRQTQVHIQSDSLMETKRTRSKSPKKRRTKERQKHKMMPLPPSTASSIPLPLQRLTRAKTDMSSRSSSSSSENHLEPFKLLQSKSKESRYQKPEHVLWSRLDLGCCRSPGTCHPACQGDCGHRRDAWVVGGHDRSGTRGSKGVTSLPLRDAIKRVKSATAVPDLSYIREVTPRAERVGKLFIDLKNDGRRRSADSAGVSYRRLSRSQNDDEYEYDDSW